jgi:hypothetical protein
MHEAASFFCTNRGEKAASSLLGKKDCATARTAEPVAASQVVAAPASSLVRLFILQSFRFEEIDRELSTRIDACVSGHGSGTGVGAPQQSC